MAIDIDKSREHILEFLKDNGVGVLATVSSSGKPHAATVYFTFDHQLNIYFITKKETQKNLNLQKNPHAAIAIHDIASQTTVQAEGVVSEVKDDDKIDGIFAEIWRIAFRTSSSSTPPISRLSAGGYIIYKLSTPTLRMATFSHANPSNYDSIFEVAHTQPSP